MAKDDLDKKIAEINKAIGGVYRLQTALDLLKAKAKQVGNGEIAAGDGVAVTKFGWDVVNQIDMMKPDIDRLLKVDGLL